MNTTSRPFQELYGMPYEDLAIGMEALYTHTMTETDIRMYAAMSGDNNPIHLNQEFAESTRFGGRIAHGMILAGFFSALFGTRLPGPGCIYVSQSMRFKGPVMIGDTVRVVVRIKALNPEKRRAIFDTLAFVGEQSVLEGEAEIYIPSR